MVVYKIDCQITTKGKKVAATKRRVKWEFGYSSSGSGNPAATCVDDIRGPEHEVVLAWSLSSGKQVILMDGLEVHFARKSGSLKLDHTWTTTKIAGYKGEQHTVQVIAHAAPPLFPKTNENFKQFDLIIDGVSYWDSPTIDELAVRQGIIDGDFLTTPTAAGNGIIIPSATAPSKQIPKSVMRRVTSAPTFTPIPAPSPAQVAGAGGDIFKRTDASDVRPSPTSVMEPPQLQQPIMPSDFFTGAVTSPAAGLGKPGSIAKTGRAFSTPVTGSSYSFMDQNAHPLSRTAPPPTTRSPSKPFGSHQRKRSGSVPDLLLLASNSMDEVDESPSHQRCHPLLRTPDRSKHPLLRTPDRSGSAARFTPTRITPGHERKRSGSVPDLLMLASQSSEDQEVPLINLTTPNKKNSLHERQKSGSVPDLWLLSLASTAMESVPEASVPLAARPSAPPPTNPFDAFIKNNNNNFGGVARRRSSASSYGGDLGRTESVPNLLFMNEAPQPSSTLQQQQQQLNQSHHRYDPYASFSNLDESNHTTVADNVLTKQQAIPLSTSFHGVGSIPQHPLALQPKDSLLNSVTTPLPQTHQMNQHFVPISKDTNHSETLDSGHFSISGGIEF